MARVEKIDRWLDSKDQKTTYKSGSGFTKSKRAGGMPFEKKRGKSSFLKNDTIIARIQRLLKEAPDSPIFLGKKTFKVKEPRIKLFKKKQYPDITSLRVDLNKLSDSGKIDLHSRRKVRTDLKKYPNEPDLHVINAIYTFQDLPRHNSKEHVSAMSQNKLNESQLTQLKKAIDEIVIAFHNGGLNVFNLNWFIKIYLEYLNIYKGRLTYEYNRIEGRNDKQMVTLSKKIKNKQAVIISLLSIKDRLGGITRLSRRLNGTTYLSDTFSPLEIKKAVTAVKAGELTKTIVENRTSGKTVFVLTTILLLLSKIPMLKELVEDVLKMIPDDDRGILLRKRMILTTRLATEFDLALVGEDKDKAREAGNQLYSYCLGTINQYTKNALLKEQTEIDPYLKAIWFIKSADGLFSQNVYKEMLAQGYKFLKTISGENNHLREPGRGAIIELSNRYLYQLDTIMDLHGWIGEKEVNSWTSREKK